MNFRQGISTTIFLLGLQAFTAHAMECHGIDCPSDILPPEECFDQGYDLPPENEAPVCDGQECPPIDDCQEPQSCEGPEEIKLHLPQALLLGRALHPRTEEQASR